MNKAGYRALAVAKAKKEEVQKRKAAEVAVGAQRPSRKSRTEAQTTDDASSSKAVEVRSSPK